jgi:hypothetical protein
VACRAEIDNKLKILRQAQNVLSELEDFIAAKDAEKTKETLSNR